MSKDIHLSTTEYFAGLIRKNVVKIVFAGKSIISGENDVSNEVLDEAIRRMEIGEKLVKAGMNIIGDTTEINPDKRRIFFIKNN